MSSWILFGKKSSKEVSRHLMLFEVANNAYVQRFDVLPRLLFLLCFLIKSLFGPHMPVPTVYHVRTDAESLKLISNEKFQHDDANAFLSLAPTRKQRLE